MSLQTEYDVQRVVAAMKAEMNLDPGSIEEKHARQLAEYEVQRARMQAELDQVKAERDAALSQPIASNPKFQKLIKAAQLRAEAAQLEQQAL